MTYSNERETGDEGQVHNGANTATNVTVHGVADISFGNDSEIGGVQMDELKSDSDDEEDVCLGSDDESDVSQEVFHPVSVKDQGNAFELLRILCKVCFKNSYFLDPKRLKTL